MRAQRAGVHLVVEHPCPARRAAGADGCRHVLGCGLPLRRRAQAAAVCESSVAGPRAARAGERSAARPGLEHGRMSERRANPTGTAERRSDAGPGEGHVMFFDYPFQIDGRGRTALTSDEEHIRDLIEQVLFTAPGERVNRPTFGSGLPQLLFMPTNDELVTATQFLVQGALQQWLGDI